MTEQQQDESNMPTFRMQKMYIKDLSFESPNAPKIFLTQHQEPKVDFNLQLHTKNLDEQHWEVTIAITAKIIASGEEETVLFIAELEHAAIFLLNNIPKEHLERVLAVDCPLMLFPYTRQVVSQISVDGGFVPFLMEPINFIALYENAQKQKENKQ
ncbi:MAG: protein-export chaperone SecB [Desulfobulbaceae bacterium]|nr:protein-export chaperone SecB [Desulfobulbaceae bacterium]